MSQRLRLTIKYSKDINIINSNFYSLKTQLELIAFEFGLFLRAILIASCLLLAIMIS